MRVFLIGQATRANTCLLGLDRAPAWRSCAIIFIRRPSSSAITGSMFLGFTLGVISLQTFTKSTFLLSLTIPMLVLGVPIYDALLAIWRRSVRRLLARGGAGIMQADLEHVHHRLRENRFEHAPRGDVVVRPERRTGVLWIADHAVPVACPAGIFLIALLAVAYVLMRHLAVIELRDTGRALLNGLRRPTHATFKALSYPVWDMICLSGSVALAMAIFEPPRDNFWHSWFLDLPVWVTPSLFVFGDLAHVCHQLDAAADARRAPAGVHASDWPPVQPGPRAPD